jgi:Tfp pilus assembly protein PilV
MYASTCNKKGFSVVEAITAILIVSIGLVALLAAQPQSWNLAGKSDNIGRAAGIMESELSRNQAIIMNPLLSVPVSSTKTVYASGQTQKQPGDAVFTVATNIDTIATGVWRVKVNVTWPGNTTGIKDTLIVTRQENFRF